MGTRQYATGLLVSVVAGILLSVALYWVIGALVGGFAMGRLVGETRKKAVVGGIVTGLIIGIFVSQSLYSLYTSSVFEPSYTWLYTSGSLNRALAIETALLTGVLGSTVCSAIGSVVGQRSFKRKSVGSDQLNPLQATG